MLKNMFDGVGNGVPLCYVQHSSAQVSFVIELFFVMSKAINTNYTPYPL
jgi:hypothetical protein